MWAPESRVTSRCLCRRNVSRHLHSRRMPAVSPLLLDCFASSFDDGIPKPSACTGNELWAACTLGVFLLGGSQAVEIRAAARPKFCIFVLSTYR
jgi:hypothetical protein